MNENKNISPKSEQPILDELEKIKSGEVDPSGFDKEYRQKFVEFLYYKSQTAPAIAKILKCSDKTIRRDIDDIRNRKGLSANVDFARMHAGDLYNFMWAHHDNLERLANMKESSITERIQAEFCAFRVLLLGTDKLQSLMCLPSQSQAVLNNNIFLNTPEDLKKLADDLEKDIIEVENLSDGQGEIANRIRKEIKKAKDHLTGSQEKKDKKEGEKEDV